MRLLPYESFQIETTLPPEKAVERLSEKVDQHHLAWLLKSSYQVYEYRGKVNLKEFKIRRNKRFNKNSFLPLITGSFHRVGTSTIIHVELGPRPIELLFIIMWFIGVSTAFFVGLWGLFLYGPSEESLAFTFIALFMLIGGGVGGIISFRSEASRQKIRLEGIFKGKELEVGAT